MGLPGSRDFNPIEKRPHGSVWGSVPKVKNHKIFKKKIAKNHIKSVFIMFGVNFSEKNIFDLKLSIMTCGYQKSEKYFLRQKR
jgi:hypothetical protein